MTTRSSGSTERPRLGLLQPLVDAERAAGRDVHEDVEARAVRGDPPEAQLTVGRGRGEVEAEWDLGPLLGWYPTRRGWRLEDATTLASLDLGPAPADDAPPPAPRVDRPRAGYAADQDWMRAWPARDDDPRALAAELARVAAPPEPPPWPQDQAWLRGHRARHVATDDPAATVLGRWQELLASVLPVAGADAPPAEVAAALPTWFRDACAPPWDTPAARRERARIADLPGGAGRRAGWAARWSVDEVVRHLLAGERVWRFDSAAVLDDHLLHLAVAVPGPPAPSTSVKWLLRVCGAAECVPPPQLVARARRG